ncbi:MAG: hypothetical protein AAF357_12395, partial [Verrucomicrobiota bacterium]
MSGRKNTIIGVVTAVAGTLVPAAQAQFHAKTPTGQSAVNQQAIQQARQQSSTVSHAQAGAALSSGDMILPEGKRQALSDWNPRIGQMAGKNAEIWGRAIHHSDGTFTESKQDNLSNTLEQETKSRNGVLLQKRTIMLDQYSRPSEVMIYDGRNQFKYRGLLLYDALGRFAEEQVFDSGGTLLRRKVQEYTPQGLKMPLRSWDYVENVPEDLRLVIRDDLVAEDTGAKADSIPEKKGLFGQLRSNQPS